jgi:hypothetical protein
LAKLQSEKRNCVMGFGSPKEPRTMTALPNHLVRAVDVQGARR